MTWNERVKQLMRVRGTKQADLMPVLGVGTRGAVGHYLRGRRKLSLEQLKALASYFGMTLAELTTDAAPPLHANTPAPASGTDALPIDVVALMHALLERGSPRSEQDLQRIAELRASGRIDDDGVHILRLIADELAKRNAPGS